MEQNKMATESMGKLIWKMGLPMIVSMILQSVYNIVDTAFVINMGEDRIAGNLALTYAFPIQLLIIAIGVGTGVGINGAAWATVTGQIVSLAAAMLFHYLTNKEIKNTFRALKPSWTIIKHTRHLQSKRNRRLVAGQFRNLL